MKISTYDTEVPMYAWKDFQKKVNEIFKFELLSWQQLMDLQWVSVGTGIDQTSFKTEAQEFVIEIERTSLDDWENKDNAVTLFSDIPPYTQGYDGNILLTMDGDRFFKIGQHVDVAINAEHAKRNIGKELGGLLEL